jgi:hypothetical protein
MNLVMNGRSTGDEQEKKKRENGVRLELIMVELRMIEIASSCLAFPCLLQLGDAREGAAARQ